MKTLSDDIITNIESEIKKRTPELSKYDIPQNGDDHLKLLAVSLARDVIETILYDDEVLEKIIPWLRESEKEDKRREKYPERGRELPAFLCGHAKPGHITSIEFLVDEYADQIVDSFRPKTINSEHAIPESIRYANVVFEPILTAPTPYSRPTEKRTGRFLREQAASSLVLLTKHQPGVSIRPLFTYLVMVHDALQEFVENRGKSSLGMDMAIARLAHHINKPHDATLFDSYHEDLIPSCDKHAQDHVSP